MGTVGTSELRDRAWQRCELQSGTGWDEVELSWGRVGASEWLSKV